MVRLLAAIGLLAYLGAALAPCGAPPAAGASAAPPGAHAGHTHGVASPGDAREPCAPVFATWCRCGCHERAHAGAPGPLGPVLPSQHAGPELRPAAIAASDPLPRLPAAPPARVEHVPKAIG